MQCFENQGQSSYVGGGGGLFGEVMRKQQKSGRQTPLAIMGCDVAMRCQCAHRNGLHRTDRGFLCSA